MSTDNRYIKIVNDYREPQDNEFFFSQNPYNIYGMRKLFEYLEYEYNIKIESIPGWQLKSEVKNAYDDQYLNVACGLRVRKVGE